MNRWSSLIYLTLVWLHLSGLGPPPYQRQGQAGETSKCRNLPAGLHLADGMPASYQELLDLFQLPIKSERLQAWPQTRTIVQDPSWSLPLSGDWVFHNPPKLLSKQDSHCLQLNVPFAHTNSYKYSSPPPHTHTRHTTLEFFRYRLCIFYFLCIAYLNYVLPRPISYLFSISLYPSGHAPD